MDDIYTNHTDYISDTNNNSSFFDPRSDPALSVFKIIVIIIGFILALLSIVAVFFLARKDHGTPVFIINLLISDVIQLCCRAAWRNGDSPIILYIYTFGLMASVGFMVCISLERYLVVTKPLWYRFRRDIRITVMVCVGVWTLPLIFGLMSHFIVDFRHISETVFAILLLLPLPLFIFFLVGTLKALSAARSVPDDEKRRIVAILVAVLLIYSVLFLPVFIISLVEKTRSNVIFSYVARICLIISPLADLTLYFFIRKGAIDTLLKSLCCKMSDRQEIKNTDNEIISGLCTEAV